MSTNAGTDSAAGAALGPGGFPPGFGEPRNAGGTGDNSTGTNGSDGSDDGDDDEEDDDDGDQPDVAALQAKIAQLEKDNAKYRRERRTKKTAAPPAGNQTGQQTGTPAQQQGLPDMQAQIAAAAAQARADAKAEFSEQLAGTQIASALTALNIPDAESIVEELNLSRYLTDEGDVDTDAVKAVIERYKAIAPKRRRKVGHGNSGVGSTASSKADQFAEALGIG